MTRLGLKISCFVVSVIIWVQVASTSTVEQVIGLPLRITGVSESLTLVGSEIPDEIRVRVQGSKLSLLAHSYFNRYIGEVRISASDWSAGPTFVHEVDRKDVVTDLVVVGIQPRVRLDVHVDHLEAKLLPVRLVTQGVLPPEVGFLVPPLTTPDSVLVTGPSRYFDKHLAVMTEPLDLGRRQESDNVMLALTLPHEHLELSPENVEAQLQVARIVERTMANIAVTPLVDAEQLEVGISPMAVDVMVRGVEDSVRSLESYRVMVTVPVGDLPRGSHTVAGDVILPSWLTLIRLSESEFQVVVGHFDPAAADSLRLAREPAHE